MVNPISREQYILQIKERLKNMGFHIVEKVPDEAFSLVLLAKRTKFELRRFGFFSTIVIISLHTNPGLSELMNISSVCFKIAQKSIPIHPPRGIFYGFLCLPLAVAETISDETGVSIRQLDMPKHWAAFERLVVFNGVDSKLYYSEKKPYWGSLYHKLDTTIINDLLGIED